MAFLGLSDTIILFKVFSLQTKIPQLASENIVCTLPKRSRDCITLWGFVQPSTHEMIQFVSTLFMRKAQIFWAFWILEL